MKKIALILFVLTMQLFALIKIDNVEVNRDNGYHIMNIFGNFSTSYQIFLDTDNNKNTGFTGLKQGNKIIGADYRIFNQKVYEYIGNGSEWKNGWTRLSNLSSKDYLIGSSLITVKLDIERFVIGDKFKYRVIALNGDWYDGVYPNNGMMVFSGEDDYSKIYQNGTELTIYESYDFQNIGITRNIAGSNIDLINTFVNNMGFFIDNENLDINYTIVVKNGGFDVNYEINNMSNDSKNLPILQIPGILFGNREVLNILNPHTNHYLQERNITIEKYYLQEGPEGKLAHAEDIFSVGNVVRTVENKTYELHFPYGNQFVYSPVILSTNNDFAVGSSLNLDYMQKKFRKIEPYMSIIKESGNNYIMNIFGNFSTGYQIFLDVDNNKNTGFIGLKQGKEIIGADYKIFNQKVYKYIGNGSEWKNGWTRLSNLSSKDYLIGSSLITVKLDMERFAIGDKFKYRVIALNGDWYDTAYPKNGMVIFGNEESIKKNSDNSIASIRIDNVSVSSNNSWTYRYNLNKSKIEANTNIKLTIPVRFSDGGVDEENWIYTLYPYKEFFNDIHAPDKYIKNQKDLRPIQAIVFSYPYFYSSVFDSRNWVDAPVFKDKDIGVFSSQKMLNLIKVLLKNRGYARSMIWNFTGTYSAYTNTNNCPNAEGSYQGCMYNQLPFQFVPSNEELQNIDIGNFEEIEMGYDWGISGNIPVNSDNDPIDFEEWRPYDIVKFDFNSTEHLEYARHYLEKAKSLQAPFAPKFIRLDAFNRMDLDGRLAWLQELKNEMNTTTFAVESSIDYMHARVSSILQPDSMKIWLGDGKGYVGTKEEHTLTKRDILGDYLNPGAETLVWLQSSVTEHREVNGNFDERCSYIKALVLKEYTPLVEYKDYQLYDWNDFRTRLKSSGIIDINSSDCLLVSSKVKTSAFRWTDSSPIASK